MTRLALGAVVGIAVGLILGAACGIRAATEPDEDTVAAAQEAGVDALDLQGALNSLEDAGIPTDAHSYLIAEGALAGLVVPSPAAPAPSACGWPICGALGQRIFCVEGIESRHGAAMYNPTPWYGEHAQGWLGWLPSTARRWGVAIGNRASEWDGAMRMILAGAGRQFYGIASGRC